VNNTYRFEIYLEDEIRTFEELKNRYNIANHALLKIEAICTHVKKEFGQVELNVYGLISRARDALERLREIALKPNPLSVVQYIELLIESEKQEAKLGWQQRIEHLNNAKQKAELIEKVQDPSYSPFKNYESLQPEPTSNAESSDNVEQEVPLHETDLFKNNSEEKTSLASA
jgi:hypothetical protein